MNRECAAFCVGGPKFDAQAGEPSNPGTFDFFPFCVVLSSFKYP